MPRMINDIELILRSYFSDIQRVRDACSAISGVVFLGGFYSYICAIIRKETVPVKITWTLGAILDMVTFFGMMAKKTLNFQIVGACVGSVIVMLLSWKHGSSGWKPIDVICAMSASLGILLWIIFGNSEIGISISCITMLVSCVPMFKATWIDPSKEDKVSWTIFLISCIFELFALTKLTIADAAQPITFTIIELTMVLLICLRSLAITTQKAHHVHYSDSPL